MHLFLPEESEGRVEWRPVPIRGEIHLGLVDGTLVAVERAEAADMTLLPWRQEGRDRCLLLLRRPQDRAVRVNGMNVLGFSCLHHRDEISLAGSGRPQQRAYFSREDALDVRPFQPEDGKETRCERTGEVIGEDVLTVECVCGAHFIEDPEVVLAFSYQGEPCPRCGRPSTVELAWEPESVGLPSASRRTPSAWINETATAAAGAAKVEA